MNRQFLSLVGLGVIFFHSNLVLANTSLNNIIADKQAQTTKTTTINIDHNTPSFKKKITVGDISALVSYTESPPPKIHLKPPGDSR